MVGILICSKMLCGNVYIFISFALGESVFLDVLQFPMKNIYHSNTLENITRLLIGQCQKFATVYPVIYCRKLYVMSNVASDWSM